MNTIANNDLRPTIIACGALALAAALAWLAPLFVVAWATLILGAPHILADIRYLVLRPGLQRDPKFLAIAIICLFLAAVFFGLRATFAGALILIWITPVPILKKLVPTALLVPLWIVALKLPGLSDFTFVYAHNFLALIIWWLWLPHRRGFSYLIPILFVLLVMLLALVPASPLNVGAGLPETASFNIAATLLHKSTNWQNANWLRIFCFTQSTHFLSWLYLIPMDDHRHLLPKSINKFLQELFGDCGRTLVIGTIVATLVLVAWGFAAPDEARMAYLRVAGFHGHLEILILCWFFTKGRTHAHGLA